MCLILVSNPTKGDFKFILASNRDEFYERKTNNMFWWSDIDGLLAGQDLEPVSYTHLTLPTSYAV